MDMAVSAQHCIAAEDVAEHFQLVTGDQGTHHLTVFLHRNPIHKNLFPGQFALKQVRQRRFPVPCPVHHVLNLRLHIGYLHTGAHRLVQNCHYARVVHREIGHRYEIVAQLGLIQDLGKIACLFHIAEFQKAGHGGKDLEIRTDLLVQPAFIFLRLRAHLAVGDLHHGVHKKSRHPNAYSQKKQPCYQNYAGRMAQTGLYLFFFHRVVPLSACRTTAGASLL